MKNQDKETKMKFIEKKLDKYNNEFAEKIQEMINKK